MSLDIEMAHGDDQSSCIGHLSANACVCLDLWRNCITKQSVYCYGAADVLSAIRRGLWNLTKQRPSTAPVGNDALMAALRQLGAEKGEDLAVWKFMSAGDHSKSPSLIVHV